MILMIGKRRRERRKSMGTMERMYTIERMDYMEIMDTIEIMDAMEPMDVIVRSRVVERTMKRMSVMNFIESIVRVRRRWML